MRTALLALLAMALATSPGAAQRSVSRRFMAGIYLHTVAVNGPAGRETEPSTNVGGGIGARLGWGITRRITLFTSLSGAGLAYDKADSNAHSAVTFGALGASYHFTRIGRSYVPYVEIAGSTIYVEDRGIDAVGVTRFEGGDENAWTIGGGVDRRFSETWHVNVGVDASRGYSGSSKPTLVTRLNLGLTYRPYEEPERND